MDLLQCYNAQMDQPRNYAYLAAICTLALNLWVGLGLWGLLWFGVQQAMIMGAE